MLANPRIKLILNSLLPPLLLFVAFAIFVFYGFGRTFPPGLNHDAAWHGLVAFRILDGAPFKIYISEAYGHEMPYYYVMAAVFALIGHSKESIELTATLFGYISVVLFYWIVNKKTRNPWLAFALSLLWISSSALVLFSRVGWQLITLIPAALWVAGSLRFYLDEQEKSRFWAIMLGVASGVTLYTYNGGRAILLFLPLFWFIRLIQTRFERKVRFDAALSLAVFAVVCAPMLVYAASHWQEWNGRASALIEQSGGLTSKLPNVLTAFGYFNFSANGDDFFTKFPVLEGPMMLLWIGGFIFALIRFRTYWPEILLFGIFILPGIATQPSFHRSIGTLPIIYLLTCYFLVALGRAIAPKLKDKRILPAMLALIIAIQIGSGWQKLYIEKRPFKWGFYPDTFVIGSYLHAHPEQKFVVYAPNWPRDALLFLSTTDIKSPGENFANYQAYNTPSGDGLPEIERDLASGAIARPVRFVVDAVNTEKFVKAIKPHYRLKEEEQLMREEAVIAHVFIVE